MSRASDALTFLRNFWGLLAAAAVAFPGAAVLLKVPIAVESSKIAALYPVAGVVVSAFALLLATAYRDRFVSLAVARIWAVRGMATALIFFFGFVGVRMFLLDVDYKTSYIQRDGDQLVKYAKSRGLISESILWKGNEVTAIPNTESVRGDPWDLLALALFTGVFASLSVSFAALGLHVYVSEKQFQDEQAP